MGHHPRGAYIGEVNTVSKHHHWFRPGQRVRVVRMDGRAFIDQFEEAKGRHIVLRHTGRLPCSAYRTISIYRGKNRQHNGRKSR